MASPSIVDVRPAGVDDRSAIVEIYNHHVVHGRATFDVDPVTVQGRAPWFARFAESGRHRLLVAADRSGDGGGEVLGYACSGPYRDHPAFDDTVEFSVYLAPTQTGRGVGSQLYERLLAVLRTESVHRAVAGIALPNEASIRLHERIGFQRVGVFDEYAAKHGERISSLWMQLLL